MSFLFQPWHILLACLCGMVNQRQQQIIDPEKGVAAVALKIECRERLGGMLKYYHRRAA